MCGITGIAGDLIRPEENIKNMNRQIIRRGPDAGGYWLNEKGNVILGHRRLSIVDLSENGNQPMCSHNKKYMMVYNGEIYNAEEIRIGLYERGEKKFSGTSDTEVLLSAIEVYGLKKTLEMSHGMFAIALYNRETGELQLARDRMGEKPLYYGMVNGNFVFASDLNAVKAVENFHNSVSNGALGVYLQYGYIPTPYSIYENIYKLEPGTILTIKSPFKKWETEKYYDIADVAKKGQMNLFQGDEKEAADELERLLKKAISNQMVADVPLGAFLSGGIDSTLVVSLMQSLSKEKIKTFTIGFEEKAYNEATFAKETASYLGTDHTEMIVGFQDVMDLLPVLPKVFGEPFADSSQLPTMLVSKMTRKHVTVSLSGDAGDEFFCGYNSYKDVRKGLEIMQGKLPFIKEPFRNALGQFLLKCPNRYFPIIHTAGQCLTAHTPEDFYRAIKEDQYLTKYLLKQGKRYQISNDNYRDGFLKGAENNLMLMDMKQYLPDDILVKVDRSGMYYSLETRIPLLDVDVMNFAWTLPQNYKMENGITKKPMRNVLYRYVPEEMMNRPKKGFSVPISRWLKEGEMREWAESIMVDSREKAGEYLDIKIADRFWKEFIKNGKWCAEIWYLLVFEQWLLQENS